MATISGKRFQMTDDGTSYGLKLFPYTVTEAVYGLSTVIANAISAFQQTLGSMAYETATNYLPKSAGIGNTITGALYISTTSIYSLYVNSAGTSGAGLRFQVGGTTLGSLMTNASDNELYYNNNKVYHSGNFVAGTDYVSISGAETITGRKIFTGSVFSIRYDNPRIGFYTSAGTMNGVIAYRDTVGPEIYTGSTWNRMYHSGNSNKSDVTWACSTLTASSAIDIKTGAGSTNPSISFKGNSDNRAFILRTAINQYNHPDNLKFIVNNGGTESTLMTIVRSGNVGIGTDSPAAKLDINGSISSTSDQVISSDATLKTNLKDVTYSVSDIAKCRAVTFDWKDGRGHSAGSIAQDWKPLVPELVHGEEGKMTLAYGQIALVNTIIEAREIEVLKKRVAELEDEVKRLRS